MKTSLLALPLAVSLGACATAPSAPPAVAPTEATSLAAAPAPSAPTAAGAPSHVDGATAHKLVKEGARLVDVRSPSEFAEGHIVGAENIPAETADTHDFGGKDAPVIVYCRSGRRSGQVAATLRAKGYTRVYELGAMSNWEK